MSEKELLATIENKRIELVQTGINHGLSSPVALKQSQELDELLNFFERIQKSNNKEKNT